MHHQRPAHRGHRRRILMRSVAALAAVLVAGGTASVAGAHAVASRPVANHPVASEPVTSHRAATAESAARPPGAPAQASAWASWAIGPFTRYRGNPILSPPTVPTPSTQWEWPEAFNPAVVVVHGVFHMLYRGAMPGNYSSIGAATSTDGHHFTQVTSNPVIRRSLPSETHGVEDPRLYYLNGKYYAFFTGYDGIHIGINEAVSTDAVHWKQLGPVIPNDKNAAVVADPHGTPVKLGGHYVMYYGQTGSTYVAESTNMVRWTTVGAINLHFPQSYAPYEICVGVTDYQTRADRPAQHNIDLFVAGELMGHGAWYYAISEVEFSAKQLRHEMAQLSYPVLAPRAPYEIYGYTPHTVFMNTIMFYGGKWWMYYGAGDSVVALANSRLRPAGA